MQNSWRDFVSCSTIYVTSRGAWKLGGLEHAGDDDEVDDDGGVDVHPEQHQQRQQDPCAGKL